MYVYIDIILIICIVPSYSNVQVFDWVPISGPAIVPFGAMADPGPLHFIGEFKGGIKWDD